MVVLKAPGGCSLPDGFFFSQNKQVSAIQINRLNPPCFGGNSSRRWFCQTLVKTRRGIYEELILRHPSRANRPDVLKCYLTTDTPRLSPRPPAFQKTRPKKDANLASCFAVCVTTVHYWLHECTLSFAVVHYLLRMQFDHDCLIVLHQTFMT